MGLSLLFPSRVLTVDAAVRDLTSGSPRARQIAVHALGNASPPDRDRAGDALRAALEDDSAEVRAAAANALGGFADDDHPLGAATIEALIARLDDGVPAVRQAAAIALGSARAPAAFVPLTKALRDGSPDLRFQAATSLCEIDPLAAYPPLVAALEERDPLVLGAIALSLGATEDPRAVGHLARLLDHASLGVRFDAAYALAQLGDPRGREVLVAALVDNERAWDATCALIDLAAPSSVPAIAGLIDRRATHPHVQLKAAAGVLHLEPDGPHAAAARARLLAALDDRKLPVRGLAVEELGRFGGAWALAPLERLADRRRGRELGDTIRDAVTAIRDRIAAGNR